MYYIGNCVKTRPYPRHQQVLPGTVTAPQNIAVLLDKF